MTRLRRRALLPLFFGCLAACVAVELSTTIQQVSDESPIVNISLVKYNKSNFEEQAFTQLVTAGENANFIISIKDIPAEVTFVIVQLHSYLYNVSMSYEASLSNRKPGNSLIGTNIGLFVETADSKIATIYAKNENAFETYCLVAIVAYRNDAPYPGGCNMEFEIPKSPFQKLIYDEATITVDAQQASIPQIGKYESPCEKYFLQHDAYRMFMLEQEFSNETYFLAIASMLTVRDITQNGDFVPPSLYGSALRRVYSAYPGTGSVYNMVARFANHSSAYVPIVTYGCDPSSWSTSCSHLTTTFSKVFCAFVFFLGFFVAMKGQHYFKSSMVLVGTILGGYIGYIISIAGTVDITGTFAIMMTIGLVTSLIWMILWMTLSSPIPSLILSGLTLGSFFFYIFYFTIPVGLLYLEVDSYFWLIFATFITLVVLIFSVIPLVGNILCFTILGAYAAVLSIDYYSGSSLKYIIINSIRRFTVPNFNVAVIQPPYQDKDILLTTFWIFLVILGLYKQCATNWNRAPFPPSTPNFVRDNEGAPLLGGQRYRNRQRFFSSWRSSATYETL